MSEQRADYGAIEKRLVEYDAAMIRQPHYSVEREDACWEFVETAPSDIRRLLARVRRYEAALRTVEALHCAEGCWREAAAALADDAQPPAGE